MFKFILLGACMALLLMILCSAMQSDYPAPKIMLVVILAGLILPIPFIKRK